MTGKSFDSTKGIWSTTSIIYLLCLLLVGGLEWWLFSPLIALLTVIPMFFGILFFQEKYVLNTKSLEIYRGGQKSTQIGLMSIVRLEVKGTTLKVWYSEKDYLRIFPRRTEALIHAVLEQNPEIIVEQNND